MAQPIEHVVIIFKENHTFDNYFGAFPGAKGVALPRAPDPIADPLHDHAAWLAAVAGDGGVRAQYTSEDIPAYWAYAENYTLCDNYFTDVASQSEPNHLHVVAAASPVIDNSSQSRRRYQPLPPYDIPSLPAALQAAGRTWRNYANANTSYVKHIASLQHSHFNVSADHFDKDVAAGALPSVSWLFPPDGLSEHPGDSSRTHAPVIAPGMRWTVDRVEAVAKSSLWAKTAIFLTWDDWGGWYDHVQPPLSSRWTAGGPRGYQNSQFRFGPRVPCLVISPYAKRGVNHTLYSHASLVKFSLRLFGIEPWDTPALAKDDPSGDMWDCFDFTAKPRLGAPPTHRAQ
jgi:phospholipase C